LSCTRDHKSFKCDANGGAFAPPLKCPSPRASRSLATLGMTAAGSRFAHARKAPSLLVFNIHVLSVDHAFIFLLTAAAVRARSSSVRRRTRPTRPACRSLRLRCLVHFFGQLVRSLGQGLASLIHLRLVVRLQRFLGVSQRILHVAAVRARDLIS